MHLAAPPPQHRTRLLGAIVVAALGVVATSASDAFAADSRWSVRADGPISAQQLGLPAGAARPTLARKAIKASAGELGLSGERMGRLEAGPSMGASDVRAMRFRQSVGGLRVLWSQLNVVVAGDSVSGIMGTVVPVRGELRGSVRLGFARARGIARRRIAGADSARRPELVAYAGEPGKPRALRRAYVVEVLPDRTAPGDDSPIGWCVVVDAATGKVLKVWRGSAASSATRPRARAGQSSTVLAQYADAKGSASTVLPNHGYDLRTNGNPYDYDQGGGILTSFGTPTSLAAGSPPFRTAIDVSTEVARFFCMTPRKYCGRDGGGRPHGYARHFFTINWGGGTAMYKPSQERIYIPKSDSRNWETAAHELGHSIDDHNADEYLQTVEGDEIDEAIAEMFSYDFSNGRPAPPGETVSITNILKDPRAAPILISHDPGGPGVKLPSLYSQYYCKATEEHLNGYILGHAYYRLVQRVGRDTAARVLMFVPFMLPAQREFGDVREAMEDGAHALFPGPNNTEGVIEQHVDDAFAEVGVVDASRRVDRCPGATP